MSRTVGRHSVLMVWGELHHLTAPSSPERFTAHASKPHQLVVDLCKVAFIDYRGLSVLLNAPRRAHRRGINLTFVCDVPRTMRMLEHLRLDRDFDPDATSAHALRRAANANA